MPDASMGSGAAVYKRKAKLGAVEVAAAKKPAHGDPSRYLG
jgi:hypothetical protein